MSRARLPGGWSQVALDVALVIWVVWWVWAGVTVGQEVRGLADLSDTAGRLGRAVTGVGDLVHGLPLIGGSLRGSADQVSQAGREAVATAQSARSSAGRLALLLALAIAVIPSLPVILAYVPIRLRRHRDRRELEQALRSQPREALDEVLAHRALVHLPYARLRQITRDPIGDLRRGEHGELADAELAWFGVRRPPSGRRRAQR